MIGSYSPLDALFDFQRALESRLESDWLRGATAGTGAFPPINVFQQGDSLVAIIELAGVNKSDLEIQAIDGDDVAVRFSESLDPKRGNRRGRRRHETSYNPLP